MTIVEMHTAFKLGIDKLASNSYPNFLSEEIDFFLNKSQDELVRRYYTGNNYRGKGVEEDEKRINDLRNITKNTNIISTSFIINANNKPNGVFVTLPLDYWFTLEDEITAEYHDCKDVVRTDRFSVRNFTHDRYNKIKNDPFNKPFLEETGKLPYEGGMVELIGDGIYVIKTYHLRYLRKPVRMNVVTNVDCELSEELHWEIIDRAVNMAIENIESPRYVTHSGEQLKTE